MNMLMAYVKLCSIYKKINGLFSQDEKAADIPEVPPFEEYFNDGFHSDLIVSTVLFICSCM